MKNPTYYCADWRSVYAAINKYFSFYFICHEKNDYLKDKMVDWCKEHLGPDGVPFYQNTYVEIDTNARWTWVEDNIYFKTQEDLILCKLSI